MAPIVYRSSAGVAVIGGIVLAVVLLGSGRGFDSRSIQAQSSAADKTFTQSIRDNGVVTVTAVKPTVEDLHRVTTQPAHIEAYERTDVYAKASGFISKVLVDIGVQVQKNQILAELWIPEMVQEERQKAALVEQSRAAVKQAEARLESADALIAAAEEKVTETNAEIHQRQAEVDFSLSEHKRISDLVASRSANQAIQDEKLKQYQAARAALAAAKAKAQSAAANVKVEHARKLQAQADVALADAQLQVAQADLKQVQILIQYAQIRAPYAGLITERWADTGDFIASAANSNSDPLFTIDRVDRLRIVFDVPESESALIQTGQRASLVVDALKGRTFEGRIARSAGVLDPRTRTLRVEAELDEPAAALRAGMYGMVSVTLAERPRTVMLPVRCIRFEEKQPFVLCVNQGIAEKRPVRLGYTDGTQTEILEGISPSDSVVLDSRFPIQPGHHVQVAATRQ